MSLLVGAARQWQPMAGCLYGFSQPSLRGELAVAACTDAQVRRVDQAFSTLAGELPQPWPVDAEGIVRRLLHWTVALQRSAGLAVCDFVQIAAGMPAPDGRTHFAVAMANAYPGAATRTLSFVLQQFNRMAAETDGASPAQAFVPLRAALRKLAGEGQNTPLLLQAALAQGLPVTRLSDMLVRLGWGSRQRVFVSTYSDRTSVIGSLLARDKQATATALRHVGLPAASHARARSADQAVAIAQRLGWPVVVKPADCDGGRGVFADLADEAAVREAYTRARSDSANVLVERHVAGVGHRLTVFNGRVVKVTAKLPWGVTGDGCRSVAELIQQDLAERAAGTDDEPRGSPSLDDEALGLLRQHGLAEGAVPDAGRFVALRRRNNAHAGGSTKRLALEDVHPDNLQLALRATEAVRLDIAGVDLIVPDIGRSWTEQAALVCEVNAMPQTDARTLEQMLQEVAGDGGVRVPVWLLLLPAAAAGPTPEQAGALAALLAADGWASPDAAAVAGANLPVRAEGIELARVFAAAVLASPHVQRAMLVMTLPELFRHGLPVDRLAGCLVAADVAGLERLARQLQPASPAALYAPTDWATAQPRQLDGLHRALAPYLGGV